MPTRKKLATTRVPVLVDIALGYKQTEIAQMLGAERYQISRDCSLLWPNRRYQTLLSKPQVRSLYCVTMFRHLLYCQGRSTIKSREILDFINHHTDDQIWQIVELAGGSKEDCDRGIEEIEIKRKQRRLPQDAINVQSTVA
jgi:hypothetical protein